MEITFTVAFLGGILSFLSPCVLPMVPVYLAYMAGTSLSADEKQKKMRILTCASLFVLGFTIAFVLVGIVLHEIVNEYVGSDLFFKFAGLLLIVLGIHTSGLYRIPILMVEKRMQGNGSSTVSMLGAFVMGLTFALGWSPCIGPILSGILAMSSSTEHYNQAVIAMTFYSLGLGVPFLLAALLTDRFLSFSSKVKRNFVIIEKVSGGLILLIGIGMLFISQHTISSWFLESFPQLQELLSVEDALLGEES